MKSRKKAPGIVNFLEPFVIYYQSEIDKTPYRHKKHKTQNTMKKSQLEEEVRVLNERIRKMEEDRKVMLKKTEKALSDQLSTIERNLYGNWKAMNAKFVKMYIKEMLDKGALTIDAKTSEGGYFNIDVMFDGKCIASTDGQICMDRFYS